MVFVGVKKMRIKITFIIIRESVCYATGISKSWIKHKFKSTMWKREKKKYNWAVV